MVSSVLKVPIDVCHQVLACEIVEVIVEVVANAVVCVGLRRVSLVFESTLTELAPIAVACQYTGAFGWKGAS